MSTENSTKILTKPLIKSNHEVDPMDTEADFERRLPSQAASPSQCHLPMATDRNIPRSTARRLGRACRWMRRDYTRCNWRIRLMITDGNERCRQRKLPSMPSHERKLYHPDDSDQEPRRDINHECGTGWHIGCRMSLGVEIRRNWDPRLGSGGNGAIEFRNSGREEKWSIERSFLLFLLFSSLLHTSLLHWISAWYKWRRHGFLPPPDRSQGEVEFPRVPDPPKGYRTVPIGSWTFEFVRVRTQHDCLMLFFLSFPSLLYGLCSPGGLRLKRGIM